MSDEIHSEQQEKKIYLARPRGFCAGVRKALDTVNSVLEKHGPPVYVLHEIVHNEYVVNGLRESGVIFVKRYSEVPPGSPLIFSAHGVSQDVETQAREYGLEIVDATCPLVKKIHNKAISLDSEGFDIILVGHQNHPEIIGTSGQIEAHVTIIGSLEEIEKLNFSSQQKLSYLTQTTLSEDDTELIVRALKEKYPKIIGEGDICYATRDRQRAVRRLAEKCEVVFVLGSEKSSNSRRLKEVVEKEGVNSYLIGSVEDVKPEMYEHLKTIGITAAASAPEILVIQLVDYLCEQGWSSPEEMDEVEGSFESESQ